MPASARWVAEVVGIAALYVATGKIGFLLAIPPGNVTIVWPPSGLALAAVLLLGTRAWAGIWVGSFLVNTWFFAGITHPFSVVALAISCSIGVGSTLQALLGAGLIRRLIGSGSPLDRPQDVFTFAGIELFSCMVAATFGVTSLSLARFASWDAYAYTWWTWWLGDVTGVLIVTPLLLTFRQRPRVRWEPRRLAEAGLVLGLLVLSSQIVFGDQFQGGLAQAPLEFVLIPFLIWMAFRFGQPGVVLSIGIVSGMAIWGTLHGVGPFRRDTRNESLMLLQAFLGIVTVTGLVLAAAILERRRAEEALRTSERRLTGALDVAEAAVISVDETQRIILFDPSAEKIFGYPAHEVLGQPLDLLLPARFTDAHRQHLRDFAAAPVAARRMGERREVFGRRKDGTEFPAEAAISRLAEGGRTTFTAVLRDITGRKQAAAALEHAHAKLTGWVTELEQRTRQITLLSDMGDLLQSCLTPQEAYTVIRQFGQTLFPAGAGMLGMLDVSKRLVEVVAVWGEGPVGERLFAPETCWAL
ncbi:MAG: MASE1 domain-containing protein, partial [candidate division NC10 bacterium]|nr:MASE1 domain-containing protein [candidate division NC10 bacterium]